ncbi:hypothetical protein FA95DRAFT_1684534 [Auriscalpium vulgare]|uniref:Uncharacterized protein n=1 Tax=Auriscalpium vulgare TaxID=40419 RepID=A0ACB8R3Q0_9AGAM|nr:hypothetical protein FA95DRAFT_1684534 [Auriscalpium vulgare]
MLHTQSMHRVDSFIDNADNEASGKHNSRIPAVHLPPEILTVVFSILSSIAPPLVKTLRFKSRHELGWLNATHVCQRWRSIAIHNPSLWASSINIPFVLGDRWEEAFLFRAQDVPLTITDHPIPAYPMTPFDLFFIRKNLARTRVLCMHTSEYELPSLCAPAPILQSLDIVYSTSIDFGTAVPFIPDSLLGGATGAPALLHLSIQTHGPLPWTSPLLAGLVSLAIRHGSTALRDMLGALSRMRHLQRLSLYLEAEDDGPHPTVRLVALRYIHLDSSISSARTILAHLSLPTNACIECTLLRCSAPDALVAFFAAAAACVTAHILRVTIEPIVAQDVREKAHVDVTAWRAGDAPALALRLVGETPGTDLVPCALEALASEHLEELAVRGGYNPGWAHVLRRARGLRQVEVCGPVVLSFCAALWDQGFLPALSVLVISGVDLTVRQCAADWAVAAALPRCLAERARGGRVMRKVEFVGWEVDDNDVRRLQESLPGMAVIRRALWVSGSN